MKIFSWIKFFGFILVLMITCIIYIPFIILGLLFNDPFGIYRELFFNAYLFKKKHFPDL